MTGYLAYLWLEATRQWRDRQALLFRLGLPAAAYLILIAVQDRPERSTGGLPWETGRAAKIAVAMSFALPAIALVAAVGGLTDHVTLDWTRWIELVALMWLATAPIAVLGALLGLAFAAQAAQGATHLAFLVLWLLGGIFTAPDSLPDTLAAVARSLPSYGRSRSARPQPAAP